MNILYSKNIELWKNLMNNEECWYKKKKRVRLIREPLKQLMLNVFVSVSYLTFGCLRYHRICISIQP